MYMYVCVCMYVYVCICVCIYIYIYNVDIFMYLFVLCHVGSDQVAGAAAGAHAAGVARDGRAHGSEPQKCQGIPFFQTCQK